MRNKEFFCCVIILCFFIPGCGDKDGSNVIAAFPIENIEGIISLDGVVFDPVTSSDGNGSLKIASNGVKVFQLFETGDVDVEDCVLSYKAKIKTENLNGKTYLMMLCGFTGKGEAFSKGFGTVKSGNMNWSSAETPFLLKKGENPNNIKLQIVCEGTGIIWIDDIQLIKTPNEKK